MRKTNFIVSLGLASLIGTAATAVAADPPAAKPAAEAPKAAAEAPKAAAEAPKAPSPAAVAAGKKIDWEKMDVNAKKKYMKATVLPTMKKLFVAFDKKKYAPKFNCMTCHGEHAADRKFKMPSPEIPKLPQPTNSAGFMALQQKKPEAAKFMGTEVKPTMAALLGKTEWTPTTPDGFGCYGCHTKEEAAAPPAATPAAPGAKPGAAAPAPAGKPAAAPAPGAPPPAGKGW